MNTFTYNLYENTKELHKEIDLHDFVKLIKINPIAGDIYIEFNKLCIYYIQNELKDNLNDIYKKLYRENCNPDYFIEKNINLNNLILQCRNFPIENSYLFYLGILKGGNLLKRYIHDKHHEFLSYQDSNTLVNSFKEYLNKEDFNKAEFISNVKESYRLIKLCFDDFII